MHIVIKGTGIELTEPLKTYVEEKVGVLERYVPAEHMPVSAAVEVGRATQHHLKGGNLFAEVNLRLGGKVLRAKVFSGDVRAAIDEAHDELQVEIGRLKGKEETLFMRGARSIKKLLRLDPSSRFRKSKIEE